MSQLSEVYTGLRIPLIRTLELTCSAWPESIYICNGFKDQILMTEDDRTLVFKAINFDVQLANKNNKGNQTLAFALDNTTGEVRKKVDLAMNANVRVTATYRQYLATNKMAPAEAPYKLTVKGGSLQGAVAQLQCGYFDLIGKSWPRDLYTIKFAPGLNYLT